MECRFFDAGSKRWRGLLALLPHDVYHLPQYVELAAEGFGGEAALFVAEEDGSVFAVPLIFRPIDPDLGSAFRGRCDAASPYGYPGPLINIRAAALPNYFLERAMASLLVQLRERQAISCFLRFHPLLTCPLGAFCQTGQLVRHGETVAIDLRATSQQIWHDTRRCYRKNINRARRDGQQAWVDEDWQECDSFIDVYRQTMQRRQAGAPYAFALGDLFKLRACLGPALHLGMVRVGSAIAGGALFTELCGIVQYYLCGTREAFLGQSPMKMLLHHMTCWAKERGNRYLHLGGGVGARHDTLFQFKAGFSRLRCPFYTWRCVVDAQAYEALVRRWQVRHRGRATPDETFFPAYRANPHQNSPNASDVIGMSPLAPQRHV